jgi:GT2 family glycosyltransferase
MVLSVVVVSYNTKKLLKQCLESVYKYTKGISFEVIVVDNASKDGSVEVIKNLKLKMKNDNRKFKIILNNKNFGFAKANNQGMEIAQGKYLLLLNSDTKLQENSFKKMIDWMDKNKKVGISSCQLVYQDGSIQRTGGYFPTLPRIFAWVFFIDDLPFIKELIKPFHPHEPQAGWLSSQYFQKQRFQDWVTGAFFLIRKKVIGQIGGLDEKFFMYVEEMEFCYRAKRAGWQIAYVPLTKIIHLARKSGSQAGALLGEYRGLVYFYQKHKPAWQFFLLKILLRLGALLRLFIFGIIMADREKRKIYAQALAIN